LKVNKIFRSIQGELPEIGLSTVFVRFQGCNLDCKNCDTKYALDPNGGTEMTVGKIFNEVMKYDAMNVDLTGGEPLLQDKQDLIKLIRALKDMGYRITVETNGSINIPGIFMLCDIINFDIKTPSGGMKNNLDNFQEYVFSRHINKFYFKAVISDWDDYEFVKNFYSEHMRQVSPEKIILQPNWEIEDKIFDTELMRKVVEDNLKTNKFRIGFQLHKVIWDPKKEGV